MAIIRTNQRSLTSVLPHANNPNIAIPGGLAKIGFAIATGQVRAVLDRYSNLTGAESIAIADFVVAEILNGNWDKYDDLFPLFLTNSADSLTGMKHMTAVVIADADPAVQGTPPLGWTIHSQGLDTQTVPSAPFVLDSASMGYVATTNAADLDSNNTIIGSRLSGSTQVFMIRQNRIDNGYDNFAHSADAIIRGPGAFPLGVAVVLARNSSTDVQIYEDGVSVDQIVSNSVAATTFSAGIGVTNTGGVFGFPANNAVIQFAFIASGGMDWVGQNTNIKAMIAAL